MSESQNVSDKPNKKNKDTTRTEVLRFRITKSEKEKIYKAAKELHLSVSDYIRNTTLGRKSRRKKTDIQAGATLHGLHRLAQEMNKMTFTMRELDVASNSPDERLNNFNLILDTLHHELIVTKELLEVVAEAYDN